MKKKVIVQTAIMFGLACVTIVYGTQCAAMKKMVDKVEAQGENWDRTEEYRAVIAFGLLEGLIPHWQSINCGTAREDSKRLLFVICSRAKEKLFLIAEQGRSNFFDQEYEINEDIKEILNAGY